MRRREFIVLALVLAGTAMAQSTDAIIVGRVFDETTGRRITGVNIVAIRSGTQNQNVVFSSEAGWYALTSLSPGIYTIRATTQGYQTQETNQIELPVSGRMQLDLALRYLAPSGTPDEYSPAFVTGTTAFVHMYTSDLEATRIDLLTVPSGVPGVLESSLSYVVSPAEIERLPLSGRDLYTALALQPGVNSYAGTARGLSLTITGERPTAINFLLDGLENNNHLTTGPMTNVVPESMQEYRISTHDYSAEFGRTGGAVANAVSRSGLEGWHALFYGYLKNAELNANGFQEKADGYARAPMHEVETGASVGGRLYRDLFFSLPFDFLRYRNRNTPQNWLLPTRQFIQSIPQDRTGGLLLRTYVLSVAPDGPGEAQEVAIASPVEIDRYSAIPRIDFMPSLHPRHRVFARVAFSALRQPGLFASPFPGLSSPYRQNGTSAALGYTFVQNHATTNEFRFGYGGDSTRVDRLHNEIPISTSADQTALPWSPAAYTFHQSARTVELLDNVNVVSGKNVWKFGVGILCRHITTFADVVGRGQYLFNGLADYASDQPFSLLLPYDRSKPNEIVQPPFDREYRENQFNAFATQSTRLSRRLQANIGFRYEYFGAPKAVGQGRDYLLELGSGGTISQNLANAGWRLASGSLFTSEPGDLGVRAGLAFDVRGSGATLLKLGYGMFFDRRFDNDWETVQTNRLRFGYSHFAPNDMQQTVDILRPAIDVAREFPPDNYDESVLPPTTFQPSLRNTAVHQFFGAVQQRLPSTGFLEAAYAGSVASGLLTTDSINRPYSQAPESDNALGLINPSLPAYVAYRANQGKSNYHALTATWRFLTRRVRGQAAYTWSHSIDLQSDPLSGQFFSFNYFNQQGAEDQVFSTFTRQFDGQSDRGNSDFDQRHNFVLYGVANIPSAFASSRIAPVFRDWQVAATAAIRSGFPFTVYGIDYSGTTEFLLNNRADLKDPLSATVDVPVPGGRQLLNPDAFAVPQPGRLGTLGRNAFTGPGLISFDASLARSFVIGKAEAARVTVRADIYNVMNHANLNNPESTVLGSSQFGIARYGREESNSAFPLLTPFRETSRVIQLMLRVQF
jgi:hypothetical protein